MKMYRNFVKKLVETAHDCRTGRGPKYCLEKIDGTWFTVGIAPTLPSSPERNMNFYKYKIIVGYEPKSSDVSSPRISPLMKVWDLLEVLTDSRHKLSQEKGFRNPPFEWMEIVESDRDVFMDNGYLCMEWFVK